MVEEQKNENETMREKTLYKNEGLIIKTFKRLTIGGERTRNKERTNSQVVESPKIRKVLENAERKALIFLFPKPLYTFNSLRYLPLRGN